ncbi:A disintegrin and metalloproteinase with thrombospondin motifs like isoform X2 [Bacillus rossius redtenbacheri]|uniref:A disintegrin and metalloproteinase with thrombospondin motifs like isoform X2 n=1 Tax=Bacillus rossius redtenbacheri TaxID=93214 RepID=UPI002FDD7EA7
MAAVRGLLLLAAIGHLGAASPSIHKHMSEAELRRVFQVEKHDQVPEYEVVPVSGHAELPDQRSLRLKAFGRDVRLKLQRATGLFPEDGVKVWTAEANSSQPGSVQYTELPQEEDEDIGELYQDEENVAALLLHRDSVDGGTLVEGTIGHDLVVRPVPAGVRQHLDQADDDEVFLDEEDEGLAGDVAVRAGFPLRRSRRSRAPQGRQHIVYRRSAPADPEDPLGDYAFMEPDHLAKKYRTRRSVSKREAPYVIYPEILVIVDYDGYRLHGGDNVQIKRYFVSFWNGVDLRYKLLKGPKVRISIAGIIISRGRDATPYLERNRVGRDAIDSAAALTDMGKYLFRERRLPVYDIAVAVTKYDMCRRRKGGRCTKGTAGFAYVGGACVVNKRLEKVNSVAIIEDTGGFSGIIVGAHEVGHLLGAVHDGSPPPSYLGGPGAEKCRWEDGYIMSDLRHTERGFRWSPCSIASFHHFLNGDTATCLFNSPHEDESLPRVLPGKLLTLDAQCRKDRGTSACFKDDRVCAQLFCFDSGSGYCVAYRPAAEGSACGDGQYCLNGRCVAEHENIIPDYSQNTPTYLRRSDTGLAATQSRPVYTSAPNSTTKRYSWEDYSSGGQTTQTSYSSTTTQNPFLLFRQYFTPPQTTAYRYPSTRGYDPRYLAPTTKSPYDFSDIKYATQNSHDYNSINTNNNQYYLNATQSPQVVHTLSAPVPGQFQSSFLSAASQNDPSFSNSPITEAPVLDDCTDKVANISGSMTCGEFLTRYGFQYCSYPYMKRNCCASHAQVCALGRK